MQRFLKILPQYIVPHHAYTRLMGWLAESRCRVLKNWMIRTFIKRYKVDMTAAQIENPDDYPTFNLFFTRELKPELRPIVEGPGQIACPVDGCVSQIGNIEKDKLIQAKGFDFNLNELLGGNPDRAAPFVNGRFTTLYLAPKDYHRIHMPVSGTLRETTYIPGKLFSVNRLTAETVPQLFSRNERLVCIFDTELGPMAMILVGAMIVGKICTIWDDNPQTSKITTKSFLNINLKRGEEMGLFKLGSTVIVLFGENKMQWQADLQSNCDVKMGQLLGSF